MDNNEITTVYVGTTLNRLTVEIENKNRSHRPASNDDTTHGSERGVGVETMETSRDGSHKRESIRSDCPFDEGGHGKQ